MSWAVTDDEGGGATGRTRRGTILIGGAKDLSIAFAGIGVTTLCTTFSGDGKKFASTVFDAGGGTIFGSFSTTGGVALFSTGFAGSRDDETFLS